MVIAKYYRAPDASQPVKAFIDALAPERRARIHFQIERLNEFGETLDYPHTSQVDGELRELRAHYGRSLYRIYYRRSDRFAVLLHIIEKRSRKLPAAIQRSPQRDGTPSSCGWTGRRGFRRAR